MGWLKIDWSTFARTAGCFGFVRGLSVAWLPWGYYVEMPRHWSGWLVQMARHDRLVEYDDR